MTRTGLAAAVVGIAVFAASAGAQAQPHAQVATQSPSTPPAPMKGLAPGSGMRWGAQNTYGWSMMTPTERHEHMAKMRGIASHAECQAYVTEHHRLMADRAKQRGASMPAEPRRDPCAGLR